MNRQTGFTLIELITVIVILGALAVIALPQYIDLQDEAQEAATDGIAGSLGAAAAVNLAGALAGDDSGDLVTVENCRDVRNALSDGLPATHSIQDTSLGSATGESAQCTVFLIDDSTIDANFTGYYVSSADT